MEVHIINILINICKTENLTFKVIEAIQLKYNAMRKDIYYFVLIMTSGLFAQDHLSLAQCYQLVDKKYPLAKQKELFETQYKIDSEIITNKSLPQLRFDVQATYQSEVTEVPIPGTGIESLNKDQYRATATLSQLIYNGGLIDASLEAKTISSKAQQKQAEVNIYQLKQQVKQIYFYIL